MDPKISFAVKGAKKINAKSAWLDGEIVSLDEEGRSDFGLLQENLKKGNTENLSYYVFDLLELNGEDLRDYPLIERKALLKKLLQKTKSKRIFFSDHFATPGGATLLASCKLGLEGIISKDKNSSYSGGRRGEWLKSKCLNGQEFVIGGYTKSDARHFKSLLLGAYNEDQELIYVGKVGTGFNSKNTPEMLKKLKKYKAEDSPFADRKKERNVTWLKPQILAEIDFRGWTKDHILRQASFKALRSDKPAKEVMVEKKSQSPKKSSEQKKDELKISNPDKILIPKAKITKKQIAEYYVTVKDLILPHISERPLSLLRCPDGINKECFFQKYIPDKKDDPIYEYPVDYKESSTKSVNYIDSLPGIIALTQLGVLEIHNWGTHVEHYEKPDLIVFDLDPGPNVSMAEVKKAALRVKEILDQLKLKSFIKTSGGKGFHIHVPIEPLYNWNSVKSFTKAIAQQLVDTYPDKYLVNMSKARRKGKIFIDYLRNGFGATSIAPYSLRARETGSIAFPIDWKDLSKVKPDQFKLKNISRHLKGRKDPWKDYFKVKQKIKLLSEIDN